MAFRPFTAIAEKLDELTREFVAGIGALTLLWAHLEFGLDVLVGVLEHLDPPQPERRHPVQFNAKLERLTAALKRRKKPAVQYHGEILQIISLSKTLAQRRHLVVHGALLKTLGEAEAELIKLTRHGDEDDFKPSTVSLHEVYVVFTSSLELIQHTYNLAIRIIREHMPEHADHVKDVPVFDVSGFRFPAVNPSWAGNIAKAEDRADEIPRQ